MCGLAVISGDDAPALVETIIRRQRHRGPDGTGRIFIGGMQLGHCRLAIIDPDGGAQPIVTKPDDSAGKSAIVANGMIYNDGALRELYRGANWQSGSDSESILHAVMRDGPEAIARLDGMFAFAMAQDGRLIAARDPIGIKPLYLAKRRNEKGNETLLLASEIKALAGIADTIEEFPAGHWWTPDGGFRRYYAVPAAAPQKWRTRDAIAALRETLEASVVKRLRSDVPFGCLLSGGLDSSIIAALAARHVASLRTFAVGLPGSPDLIAARAVASHLGTDHHELVLTPEEIAQALPDILFHLESYDRDLVRSAVPCWFVARFAARHVKVVLTGEGADELFAGYRYYRDIDDPDALHDELVRSIGSMHNINLQRVDRMAMAHGLEARVPYLDTAMIALGLSLPVDGKLRPRGRRRIEKWLLRRAFEDLLPYDIVWRDKAQFDEGSGLAGHLERLATKQEPARRNGNGAGRSAEEQWYRALLASRFENPDPVLGLVAHWNTRSDASPTAGARTH